MTESSVQSKKPKSFNYYLLLSILGCISLSFLISLGVSIGLNDYKIIYGFLINLPFILLVTLTNKYLLNLVFLIGKHNKKQVYFISILLFVIKGIILVLGVVIGLLVNKFIGETFNQYSLILNYFIFPLGTLIASVVFNFQTK